MMTTHSQLEATLKRIESLASRVVPLGVVFLRLLDAVQLPQGFHPGRLAMDIPTALRETESWPVEDQLELIDRVWSRLVDAGWQPTLTDDQKAELDRRIASADANPEEVVSWDDVVKHVRRQR